MCKRCCVSNLLYELDHADAVSLVECDRTAKTVELPREPQRRQTFGLSVKSSASGVAERLPRTLRWVQRVQGNAGERSLKVNGGLFCPDGGEFEAV